MSVEIKWLGHASFRVSYDESIIYIDPWKIESAPNDGVLVLVSHAHYDHYSAEDVAKVISPDGQFYSTSDVTDQRGDGISISPGTTFEAANANVETVRAYNPNKHFHPKENNWVGFIINISGKRVYYAGDTDVIPEMDQLRDIDVALLPVGGTFTMDAQEAAQAVSTIKPKVAIPYHWGDIVGDKNDAQKFAESAECEVEILDKYNSFIL